MTNVNLPFIIDYCSLLAKSSKYKTLFYYNEQFSIERYEDMTKAENRYWKILEETYKYHGNPRKRVSKKLKEKANEAFLKLLYKQFAKDGVRIAIELLWKEIQERVSKRFNKPLEEEVLNNSFHKTLQDYVPSLAIQFYFEMKRSNLISKGKNKAKRTKRREEIYTMFKNLLVTYVYYHRYRERLLSWVKYAKECDILRVQAPLGLGKTMAISSALKENKKKSAIIFMPTTRMCKEIYDHFDRKDAFYIEGINGKNCDNFYAIMERYNLKYFSRKHICNNCEKNKHKDCRLIKQYEDARKYRIIITTHAQYARFVHVADDRRWENKGKRRERCTFFPI